MANGKPQRRTIVKALRELAAAVRKRDFLHELSRAEYNSFNEILDATTKAESILEREGKRSLKSRASDQTIFNLDPYNSLNLAREINET